MKIMWLWPAQTAGFEDRTCGECVYYSMEEAKCEITGEQRAFDQQACLIFSEEGGENEGELE